MKKHRITKAAASLLALSLLAATPVWAEQAPSSGSVSASASQTNGLKLHFPDVASSHWAMKHITKLALLGIVEGDNEGRFNPEAPVTQEQVITMAIRMMGLDDEAKKLDTSSYYLPADLAVSDYAKAYVILAIEKRLIDPAEETSIAEANDQKWGTRPASREWVAKLSVRAIGKQDDAQKQSQTQTSFSDDGAISSWARGYINEAVSLKIVAGMDDGSFKPKSTVTRAQMAAFLSRADQNADFASNRTLTGTVTDISDSSITITDASGNTRTLALTADSSYYGLGSEKAVQISDIKKYNEVYLLYSGTTAYYVEVLKEAAPPVLPLDVEGTLVSLDVAAAKITLQSEGRELTLEFSSTLSVVDMDGKGVKLSELTPGSKLELKRNAGESQFSSIVVKEIPVNKQDQGVLQSLDPAAGKLTVLETDAGTVDYPLASHVEYLVSGQAADPSVFKEKDTISYQITNNEVVSITMVEPYAPPTDTGTLTEIRNSSNLSYLTLLYADSNVQSYRLAAVVPVEIAGMPYAGLTDLMEGDQIKVTLDDNKTTIVKISVLNRSIQTTYYNTVLTYDADSKVLTVLDNAGQPKLYQLSDKTQLMNDTTAQPISNAATYLSKGRKIDITAARDVSTDAGMVLQIQLEYAYEGKVIRKDLSLNQVTVQMNDQNSITFTMSAASKIWIPGVVNAAIASLTPGDQIRVSLTANQDAVADVFVYRDLSYKVVSVDTMNKQMTVKDTAGNTSLIYLNNVPLIGTGSNAVSISDIPINEPVTVSYAGYIVKQVKLVSTVSGKVTAVDSSAGKLTITDSLGASQSIQLDAIGSTIRSGAGTSISLSSVHVNDRVEWYQNANGGYEVQVAQALARQVDTYNLADKVIYFKRPTLNDPVTYPMHPQVYIHKGTTTLLPNMLMTGDSVNLYLIDNMVIEIEKQ